MLTVLGAGGWGAVDPSPLGDYPERAAHHAE